MSSLSSFKAEIEHHYRHNFIVNVLDGTTFWLGASFIAYRTILPAYIANLTNSKLMIGLLSTIISTGWLLPQLFTANATQRLPVKKVSPVKWGFFTERLPVLLMIPGAWLASINTQLALIVFLILVAWHLVGAGVVAIGWQDMIAKVIPVQKRGRFFGLTNFGGTATGVLGASLAGWFLANHDFPYNYMLCFMFAAIFIFISWIFLAMTREPPMEPKEDSISDIEFWKNLPDILRNDQNFRRYLISQSVITGANISLGFLAVYAIQRWGLPDSWVGIFTTCMLIGQAISNLFFGWLADRKGHKLVLELGVLATIISIVIALLAPDPRWFYAVFALSGVYAAGSMLSGIMIAFEFCDIDIRPTYIGLNNTIPGIFSAIMPIIGAWLIETYGYPVLFYFALTFGTLGLVMLRRWVQEPREVRMT